MRLSQRQSSGRYGKKPSHYDIKYVYIFNKKQLYEYHDG